MQEYEQIKLDYNLKTPEERVELVNKFVDNTPSEKLTNKYLEILSNYVLDTLTTKESNKIGILTPNREKVQKSHETSLEGLSTIFNNDIEGGNSCSNASDGGVYSLFIENDKNVFLTPKIKPISEEDLNTVPGLRDLYNEIQHLEECLKTATGRARFSIKKNIIELRKDQYVLRAAYQKPMTFVNVSKSSSTLNLYENIKVNNNQELEIDANISLLVPEHVSAILCAYSKLKEDAAGKFESDMYYFLLSLEDLIDQAFADFPLYYDLLVYKIDGLQNIDIQRELEMTFGIRYSVEHISSLWRNKIPKMLAEQAQKNYLSWYYTEKEKGYWKKCSRCGQIKLGHTKFFSKNKTSKDGWYSICKDCRNSKVGSVKD